MGQDGRGRRPAAVSGPGRGYAVDPDATGFLLVAGDEAAIPAISQLLTALPPTRPVTLHIEVAHPDARVALPDHPRLTVDWHDLPPGAAPGDTMVAAVLGAEVDAGSRVWVAGEAAAVQRIRRHLFEERKFPRARVSARGYWKHGSYRRRRRPLSAASPEARETLALPAGVDLPEERYEILEEGVVGIGAGRVVVGVGALVVRQGQVAHGDAGLLGQDCASAGTEAPPRRAPKA